jgi:Flp pilus assembly protein CpaB
VLVSLNRPSTEGSGTKEAMSMTLLQGVGVLAIDDTSVMSDPASSEPSTPETATSARRGRRDRLVTLMVNSNQAKALQLAAQYGAVSLALRNPLDTALVETDSTMLSDLADEYTRIVAALSPPQWGEPKADDHSQPSNPTQTGQDTRADRPGQDHAALMKARREPLAEDKSPRPARLLIGQPEDPKWETLVNRSGQIELVRFRRPGELWPQDALQWIWEGRALSGTNANTK